MLSWGKVRRALQPYVVRFWLDGRAGRTVKTCVEGFELEVLPGVFHPRYFGTSRILARFVQSLDLQDHCFLEMGCGSGLVALCAARSGARVTAVDINPDAARNTAVNASRHKLAMDTRVSDLFAELNGEKFDVIAWNPPYLSGVPETRAMAAFFGGPDLDVIRRFVAEARGHLQSGGSIYTIVSADVAVDVIESLYREQGFVVSRVLTTRWLLGETMLILCCR